MDVRYIIPFLEGTIEVLKTMAFVEPRPGKPYLKSTNQVRGDITGIIDLTGAVKGSLALTFTENCILNIVFNMLGDKIEAINGDIVRRSRRDHQYDLGQKLEYQGHDCFRRNPHRSIGERTLHNACPARSEHYHTF